MTTQPLDPTDPNYNPMIDEPDEEQAPSEETTPEETTIPHPDNV